MLRNHASNVAQYILVHLKGSALADLRYGGSLVIVSFCLW